MQPPPAEWHAEQLTRRCRAGYLVRSREEEALANLLSGLGFTAETAKYEERLAGWPCTALPDQFQVLPDWTLRGVRGPVLLELNCYRDGHQYAAKEAWYRANGHKLVEDGGDLLVFAAVPDLPTLALALVQAGVILQKHQ